MHANFHDAASFVREIYYTGLTYCYVLPSKCNSSLIGHLSGIAFCLYIQSIISMLNERSVVLGCEGFRYQKNTFTEIN